MNVYFQLALTLLVALVMITVTNIGPTDYKRPPVYLSVVRLVFWALLALGCLHWIWS